MAMFDRDRRAPAPAPFDGNDYRKRVLAAMDAAGGPQARDPFEYYDLPLDEVDDMTDAAVRAQIDAVWAFWQKQRDHPKYRGLVTALLTAHETLAPLLREADSRRQIAEDARRFRAERDQGRFADLDAAIDRLVQRFGGIPRGKLEGLRRFAAGARLDEVGTESRLARHPVLDDVAPAPARAAVPAAVYRQVRGDLDELGQLMGAPPPASLYDLIGLPPGASTPEVRAEREVAAGRNRELRPDRRRALVDDLLTAVTALLIEGDPDAYLDAVAEDVTVKLRPRVVAAVLVEDELTPDDYGQLLVEAEAGGLDRDRAVRVLAELAREAGVRAPAPPPRTESSGSPVTPTTSGGPAMGDRPPWERPRPSPRPRPEPPVPVDAGAWSRPLAEARAALKAGRVVEAERLVTQARQLAGGILPPIRALDDEVQQVLAEAQQHWRTVEQALAARRFHEAVLALERLVQVAVDLPSPRGTHVAGALARARVGLDEAGARLAAAESLSGAARESALLEAVRLAPDHEGLLAALQSAGVAPASEVRAERVGGGVRVSWRASPSPGTIDYKVRRGDGRPVGTTQTTELEDGLPPGGGPLPTYLVVARRAGVVSAEASSAPGGPSTATTEAATTGSGPTAPASTGSTAPAPTGPTPPPNLSPVVPSLIVEPTGRRLHLIFPPPRVGRAEVRRLPEGTTAPAPGTVVTDPTQFGDVVPAMGPGLAVDRRPSTSYVGYVVLTVPVACAGGAVVGAAAAYIDLPPVFGLHADDGRLRWDWPPGCTEVLLAWRSDGPPLHPYDPAAQTRKVTNTRYEIDGGAPLSPERPLHLAVFAATRARGPLQIACEAPASARLML
ncbi:MAG: hypothetical protein KY451_11730 [Actinobacteria bacterium]|nr:hypothetical protein [Actinomycetota bacterium]